VSYIRILIYLACWVRLLVFVVKDVNSAYNPQNVEEHVSHSRFQRVFLPIGVVMYYNYHAEVNC